jgi:transcriptional regulator with XRE-family HTH domain
MNKKTISPEPGMRVRALREKIGLTRKQFQEETGFKANTLRHIETGNQSLKPTVARMLAIFFTHLFYLSDDEASERVLLHGNKDDTPNLTP